MVSLSTRASDQRSLALLIEPVVAAYAGHHGEAHFDLIRRAGAVAIAAHEGQWRRTGEPYVTHPIAVAQICAELGADESTIVGALLHDAVEDTGMTLRDLTDQFGGTVARIVDGVTKMEALPFGSAEAQQAATIRKMIMAMFKDWRVLLVKLADRLHNMRTIAVMPLDRQHAIARETQEIYAPLADRLGIQQIKWQLDDLAFATLEPKKYAEIEQMVANRSPERELYVADVVEVVRAKFAAEHLDAEVLGRPKHYWGIYHKMKDDNKEFDDIYDLVGLRVIVNTQPECWMALGHIHALWSYVEDRFKDFISRPKHNMYQSLHTTVIGPKGKRIEVQIRTTEMHQIAEYGVAAHWGYKEQARSRDIEWVNRVFDAQRDDADPIAFVSVLKQDLDQDEVYAFTPKGRVITLVAGATPIDFAYAVHTEIGHRCVGAKVNGRLVPLDTQLRSADVVEIATSKSPTPTPSRDWLNIAVSPRARTKIRQWFQRERREDAIETGRDELVRALRRAGLPTQATMGSTELAAVADGFNFEDIEALIVGIGSGQPSAQSVVQRLERLLHGDEDEDHVPAPKVARPSRRPQRAAILIEGYDDMMTTTAKCCSPVPGDTITAFATQGRGFSVHRIDCANAIALATKSPDRIRGATWNPHARGPYRATFEVLAFNRSRLLADVSRVVSEHHVEIIASHSARAGERDARMTFDVEIGDSAQLSSVLAAVKQVDGVFDAHRSIAGQKPTS